MERLADFNFTTYLTSRRDSGVIVWLCNLGAEKYWHAQGAGVIDKYEEGVVNRIEEMNLLLCRSQDIMILHRAPAQEYLDYLKGIGFSIPRILTPSDGAPLIPISEKVLGDERLQQQLRQLVQEHGNVYFIPYAVTGLEEEIALRCGLNLVGAPSHISALVNDKIFSRKISEQLGLAVCAGRVCNTVEEVRATYCQLTQASPSFKRVVIKEPYGASGKGLHLVEDDSRLQALLARLSRLSKSKPDAAWLVEGWYDKARDINYQIFITEKGQVEVFSIKQQILKGTVYLGSKIPAPIEESVRKAYQQFGMMVGHSLYDLGYRGLASIDSIVTQDGTIIPVIEINGRFTLSTYVSFLNQLPRDCCVQTKYFRLTTRRPVAYGDLLSALENKEILYGPGSRRGVIIYTAGTLPERPIENDTLHLGRLFALVVAEDWQEAEGIQGKLEEVVVALSA